MDRWDCNCVFAVNQPMNDNNNNNTTIINNTFQTRSKTSSSPRNSYSNN